MTTEAASLALAVDRHYRDLDAELDEIAGALWDAEPYDPWEC